MAKDSGIPATHQKIMPHLIIKDAAGFIVFAAKVFGAKETYKAMRDEKIIMHAEIMIGECTIMVADATDEFKQQPGTFFVYVADADKTFKLALKEGAKVIREPSDQPYGRSGGVTDPFGNSFWITSVKN